MANLNKFSAQESLNLETTMNWNANTVSVPATDTGHIDVTGQHKIVFMFESGSRFPFKYSIGSGDDIDPSADSDFMYLTSGVVYEFPIPTMINGVKRKDSDTLYFNVYNLVATARSITYNLS